MVKVTSLKFFRDTSRPLEVLEEIHVRAKDYF
jgi:hypothetical protein